MASRCYDTRISNSHMISTGFLFHSMWSIEGDFSMRSTWGEAGRRVANASAFRLGASIDDVSQIWVNRLWCPFA